MPGELKLPEVGSQWVRNGFDIPKNSKFRGMVVTILRIGRVRSNPAVRMVHFTREGRKTPDCWYLEGFLERINLLRMKTTQG